MTNAQIEMDKSIRRKWLEVPPINQADTFKLARFSDIK